MSRREKLAARLAELEGELAQLLLSELEHAAVGGDAAVFRWLQPDHPLVTQYGYHHRPRPDVVRLVEEIESLREKLGETVTGTLTSMYRAFCTEHLELENAHRRGPRRLAEDLARLIRERRDGEL